MINIVILSTMGPNNAQTVMDFANEHANVRVIHLFSDNHHSPSFQLAKEYGIPFTYIPINGGLSDPESRLLRENACNNLLQELRKLEELNNGIHCIVSAFRKVLIGQLVTFYEGQLINVHPADLTVYDLKTQKRRYIGTKGLDKALLDGNKESRTTVHFIDNGVDTGEIISLGPFVPVMQNEDVSSFEKRQKSESDKYALRSALTTLLLN